MRKKIVYGIAIIIAFFIGMAAQTSSKAVSAGDRYFGCAANAEIYVMFDNDTGVQYFVAQSRGNFGYAVSICPRYNANGTLYTGE